MPEFWEDEAGSPPNELELRLHSVKGTPADVPGAFRVLLQTSRGEIAALFHPVEGGTGAVVCVGGAMGGLDGPADGLYGRLPGLLEGSGVSVLRLNYRLPNDFEECVLDALAGCSFLKGIGATDIVLLGHSFGAAVVINAGELASNVRAVASLSPQLHGTRQVENLGKPLLLVHGMTDSVLNHEASEDIYRRALEPKRIVLYAGTGHSLMGAKEEIDALLVEWIPERLAGIPMSNE